MYKKEALSKIRSICSRQEQCRQDILSKLSKWEVSDPDSEQILELLEQEGFIDNSRYAGSFANDKFKLNRWGKIKIRWMLRQKEIPEDIIEKALSSIDDDEYISILTAELRKKMKSFKSQDEYDKKGKLIQFATQRGFEYEIIYKAINKLIL
jgi:regulatory protein